MRAPVFSLAMLILCAGVLSAQSDTDFEGRNITRIDFQPALPNQPLPAEELDRRLGLHPGSPLHMAEVRSAIERLYVTGRYSDIAIDAEPDGEGVALRVETGFNYFISGVNIDGEAEPPNRDQLAAAAKLGLGSLYSDEQVTEAVKKMEDRLRANGFYSAHIESRVDRNPATEEAGIYFAIDTGDRARFDGVQVSGEFSRTKDAVIRATGWRRSFLFLQLPGWRELTESRLENGIGRVRDLFQKGDHLQASVVLDKLEYHPGTNRVTAALNIQGGPILEVKVKGAEVSQGRLRQLIPIYEERSVDRSLLVEGQRNLVEYFQSLGYFDATVDFEQTQPEPGRSVVEYTVVPGLRHKLVNVEFSGNRYFDTGTLRERLSISPASFPRDRWGKFSQRMLDQDKSTLEDLYRGNGFREVEVNVDGPVDNYEGVPGHLSVKFEVNEGPQWLVNSLQIEGVPETDAAYLRTILQSTEGQPFSDSGVAADRDAVLIYYFDNGYPNATFDWTETPAEQPARVNLHFLIQPGKQEYVRNILVRGLDTTRASLVANRISLEPGAPISQSRIGESQQKLYDLGIFSKVETAIQNSDGEEDAKYVLFHLDEARKYSFNAGFGAELGRIGGGVTTFDAPAGATGFSPRISLGVSRLNFYGLGHTIGVQTLASTLEQRILTTYVAPQFTGNDRLSLTLSGLFDDSFDVRTFAARRLEGSAQIAQRLTRANTVQYRLTFRRVTISDLKISPELIPLLSQPDRVGLFGIAFIQDRRDDPTNSTRGYLNTADVSYAWKGLGSDTDFTRLLFRNTTYHKIGKDWVLARSLQFGYQQRLGGLPEIPLAERFFSGGASTMRAFPDNQAGPRDLETGFPLGGTALFFHSLEFRFPLIGDNVGGVLFHDMGNVYSDINHISLRFSQKNVHDFNYGVLSVGFGIRYRTPVGPIRVDFSFSPNSPRFVGFKGTLDQLLAGTGTPNVPQRINIFQFHFSLGQTF